MPQSALYDDLRVIAARVLDMMGMGGDNAVALVMRTMQAESGLRRLKQQGGPAVGFTQLEPDTINDIWANYAMARPFIRGLLLKWGFDRLSPEFSVAGSLTLQIAFCRLKYFRDPHPIPPAGDIRGQAEYWKRVYNTSKGRGTVEHFITANS